MVGWEMVMVFTPFEMVKGVVNKSDVRLLLLLFGLIHWYVGAVYLELLDHGVLQETLCLKESL